MLSVVVCTRDRAASLARTLESLAVATPPRGELEVLVVDNGSEDETQAVIERFRERLPLRSVLEPRAGVSHARNAGVLAARGEHLLWTDDDVTVCREWIRTYEQAIEAHPHAAFFGGPIRLRFVGEPPRWMHTQLSFGASPFAGLEIQMPILPIDAISRRFPFGANMAIRAKEQREHAFDATLGRQPWRHGLLSGEETDVLKRIALAGATGMWVPEASVEHWIEPARQNVAYLRRFYVGMGYLAARRGIVKGRIANERARRRLRNRIAWKQALYVVGRATGLTAWWLDSMRKGALLRGRLLAHRDAAAEREALAPDVR